MYLIKSLVIWEMFINLAQRCNIGNTNACRYVSFKKSGGESNYTLI